MDKKVNGKKSILFINQSGEWYGSDKILYNVVQVLSQYYTCHVIIPFDGIIRKKILSLGVSCSIVQFPAMRRKYLNPTGIFRLFIEFITSVPYLVYLIISEKIDIVYSNGLAVVIGPFLAFILKRKHCWHIHEILEKSHIFSKFSHFVAKNLSHLTICVSDAVANNIGAKNNVKVIRNGIEPIIPKPLFQRKNDDCHLSAVFGRFNWFKGQLHAVKAIEYLNSQYTNGKPYKLLLVGGCFQDDTFWFDQVKTYITEKELEPFIDLKDYDENIGRYYSRVDLYLLPSTNPDPFPTVVLEAVSAGLPVLGFNHGGIQEMLHNDPGCLIPVGDYRLLGERIRYYSENETARIELAERQYGYYIQEFTKEKYNQRFLSIFNMHFNHDITAVNDLLS